MSDRPAPFRLRRSPTALLLAALLLTTVSPLVAGEPQTDEPPAGEPEKYTNTIKWATASEVDNFGYDVYRSKSADGPFARLTEEPILGAGTTDEPSYYQFVDDTIDPYVVYYYYVESISVDGVRERFTPVQEAKAKRTREQEAAADAGADEDAEP